MSRTIIPVLKLVIAMLLVLIAVAQVQGKLQNSFASSNILCLLAKNLNLIFVFNFGCRAMLYDSWWEARMRNAAQVRGNDWCQRVHDPELCWKMSTTHWPHQTNVSWSSFKFSLIFNDVEIKEQIVKNHVYPSIFLTKWSMRRRNVNSHWPGQLCS